MLLTSFFATLLLMSLAPHVRIIKQSTANEKTWGLLDALVNFTLQVIPGFFAATPPWDLKELLSLRAKETGCDVLLPSCDGTQGSIQTTSSKLLQRFSRLFVPLWSNLSHLVGEYENIPVEQIIYESEKRKTEETSARQFRNECESILELNVQLSKCKWITNVTFTMNRTR